MPPPAPNLQVELLEMPTGILVRLKGELRQDETDMVFKPKLLAVANARPKLVAIDFTDVSFVGSAGMGALATFRRMLSRTGGQARLAGLSPQLLGSFKVAAMDQLFKIYPTAEEALKS